MMKQDFLNQVDSQCWQLNDHPHYISKKTEAWDTKHQQALLTKQIFYGEMIYRIKKNAVLCWKVMETTSNLSEFTILTPPKILAF